MRALITQLVFPTRTAAIWMFVAAWMLGLSMAWFSAFNVHPDEITHVAAADYYRDHWIPPRIGDPDARSSYSVMGYSYLDEHDVVYFLAGKLGALLQAIGIQPYQSYRVFNLLLFAVLIVIWYRHEQARLVLSLLLISPQVWYLFSYFNGDAFPLFLSLLIAYQLAHTESTFRKFLNGEASVSRLKALLLMGVMLGLLLLSKRNYYVFALFVPLYIIVSRIGPLTAIAVAITAATFVLNTYVMQLPYSLFVLLIFLALGIGVVAYRRELGKRGGKDCFSRLIWVVILVGVVVAPRLALDLVRYGSFVAKVDARKTYAEQVAAAQFKPSILSKTEPSYYGSRLRDKGVSYIDIFLPPWNWLAVSAASSVGVYGYMSIRSAPWYYLAMLSIFCAFIYYVGRTLIVSGGNVTRYTLLLSGAFSLGMIFLSSYHSWISDFQAQGRYLFPILGILAVMIGGHRDFRSDRIFAGFIVIMFVLSVISFTTVGLTRIPKS